MLNHDGIEVAKKSNFSKKITFSMPNSLITDLDIYCKENSLIKSRFITHIVSNAINQKIGALAKK